MTRLRIGIIRDLVNAALSFRTPYAMELVNCLIELLILLLIDRVVSVINSNQKVEVPFPALPPKKTGEPLYLEVADLIKIISVNIALIM